MEISIQIIMTNTLAGEVTIDSPKNVEPDTDTAVVVPL